MNEILATACGWSEEIAHVKLYSHDGPRPKLVYFKPAGITVPELAVTHAAIKSYMDAEWRGLLVRVKLATGPGSNDYAFITDHRGASLSEALLRFAIRDAEHPLAPPAPLPKQPAAATPRGDNDADSFEKV